MVELSCQDYLMRFFFMVLNIAYYLVGALLISIGVFVILVFSKYSEFGMSPLNIASGVLIAVGFFIFILGLLGCWGASQYSRWVMLIYVLLVFILVFLEIGVVGVYALFNFGKTEELLRDSMEKTLHRYESDVATRKAWDEAQKGLDCCGSTGPSSWTDHLSSNMSVPDTCCIEIKENCGQSLEAYKNVNINQKGCVEAVTNEIENSFIKLGLVAVVVASCQISGLICAGCLYGAFREHQVK